MGERIGMILPDVYDGVSVWIEPDGTLTNRWDAEDYPTRHAKAQAYIDFANARTTP